MSESAPERKSTAERAWKWVQDNPLKALTGAGIVTYGGLRLSYAVFYGRFDVTPEEVGLSYVEILSQSVVALAGIAAVALLVALAFAAIRAMRRQAPAAARDLGLLTKMLVTVFAVSLLVVLPLISFWLAEKAENGGPSRFAEVILINLQAERAAVSWIGATGDEFGEELEANDSLLFLGRNDQQVVLFDYDAKATLRIPAGSVVVSVLPKAGPVN